MTSTAENASTSRTSTSESSQSPTALFEHHLKLQDSYLSFFQERAKIEEVFVDSLLRLHKKTKTFDTYLDDRAEPSSVRQVWSEIRDELEREAQSRMAFLQALTMDVINPIATLKETQDRSRKRIKEDIKESAVAHQEYAENVLPRLKRAYFKKCQEVEDNKANALQSSVPVGQDTPPVLAPTRSNPNTSPVVTSPQPLRPLARRASGHQPQPRNRSPSASNPLQDLAHQGKRQLNQLMTFLDNKGGNVKDGISGVRGDSAIRTVRAKREADEADKEYRKGVHWLETLRIRRIKIIEGAFKSLELFIEESSQKMKTTLEKYTGNLTATSTTITHLANHAHGYVSRITPQKDVAFLSSVMPRYLQQSTPKRSLYTNYYVGDCNDLIFGVGLVDYATSRGLQDGEIPKIVRICIAEVEKRGTNSEGIYRVSGRHAVVQEIIHKIEKDERLFQFYPNDDVFVVASLLKQYLRELPEPLFKFPLEDRVKHTEEREEHIENNFLFLRGKMRRLPVVHQATLKALVEHLANIAANCEKNKMDPKNLAIIFGGVVFGEDDIPKAADLLQIQSWKDSLMEDLIVHAHVLFDERAAAASSHPLPPAPANEPPPTFNYGSAYTSVSSVPPRHQKSASESSQDFTPQLPARPGNSIHPSRRANQSSRTMESETDGEMDPAAPALPPRPSTSRSIESGGPPVSEESDVTVVRNQTPPLTHIGGESTSAIEEQDDSPATAEFATPSEEPTSPNLLITDLAENPQIDLQVPSARRSAEQPHVPGPP